jgi:hypothetical protein
MHGWMDGLARKKLRDRGRKQSNNTQNQMKESSGYFSSLYKTDDLYYTSNYNAQRIAFFC